MTFNFQVRNAVFNIKSVALVIDFVVFGEDGWESCPDAFELLTGRFLGFVFRIFNGLSPSWLNL